MGSKIRYWFKVNQSLRFFLPIWEVETLFNVFYGEVIRWLVFLAWLSRAFQVANLLHSDDQIPHLNAGCQLYGWNWQSSYFPRKNWIYLLLLLLVRLLFSSRVIMWHFIRYLKHCYNDIYIFQHLWPWNHLNSSVLFNLIIDKGQERFRSVSFSHEINVVT